MVFTMEEFAASDAPDLSGRDDEPGAELRRVAVRYQRVAGAFALIAGGVLLGAGAAPVLAVGMAALGAYNFTQAEKIHPQGEPLSSPVASKVNRALAVACIVLGTVDVVLGFVAMLSGVGAPVGLASAMYGLGAIAQGTAALAGERSRRQVSAAHPEVVEPARARAPRAPRTAPTTPSAAEVTA